MVSFNNTSSFDEILTCDFNTINYGSLSYTVRLPIGIVLLLLCIFSSSFYIYVIHKILKHKLYMVHSFYLWFLSIGLGDIINLINYGFSSFLICLKTYPIFKIVAIYFGHVYQFAYSVCLLHFPTMAFVRMLTIVFPITTMKWFTLRRTVVQILFVWMASFMLTVFLQSYKTNWLFFDPSTISFNSVCWDNESPFKSYWDIVPPTLFVTSDLFISSRVVAPNTTAYAIRATQKAERNLLNVALSMTLLMTCDHISWLINLKLLGDWWSTLILSLIEITMFTSNSVFIMLFSPNLRKKSFIGKFFQSQ